MNTSALRAVGTGLFFLVVFASGIWLSRSGRPLKGSIFTVHKLVGLAMGVFLIITVYQLNQAAPLSATEWTVIVVTVLSFLGIVISGGLLSTNKVPPAAILRVHQIVPALAVISTAFGLYLLLGAR